MVVVVPGTRCRSPEVVVLVRKMIATVVIAVLAASPRAPADAAVKDHKRPAVGFTTADGAVLVAAPADSDLSATRGWARDGTSGVRRVSVTYCPGAKGANGSWSCGSIGSLGAFTTTRAVVSCDSMRRSCTWSALAPQQPGRYLVFVEAEDRDGNNRTAGPIEVYVA